MKIGGVEEERVEAKEGTTTKTEIRTMTVVEVVMGIGNGEDQTMKLEVAITEVVGITTKHGLDVTMKLGTEMAIVKVGVDDFAKPREGTLQPTYRQCAPGKGQLIKSM